MHSLEPQNSSCNRAHERRKFVSEQPGHDAKEEEEAFSQAFRASLDAVPEVSRHLPRRHQTPAWRMDHYLRYEVTGSQY